MGSRCAVENRLTDAAGKAQFCAKVFNRSAARTRRIVEDCIAGRVLEWRNYTPAKNGHVGAGRSRCVVEDYPAFVTSFEGLQNAAIVDNASAANNQLTP